MPDFHKVHKTNTTAAGATNQTEGTPVPIPAKSAARIEKDYALPGSLCQWKSSSMIPVRNARPVVYTSAMTACDQNV